MRNFKQEGMVLMDSILRILDREQGKVDVARISAMLGMPEAEVAAKIETLEK